MSQPHGDGFDATTRAAAGVVALGLIMSLLDTTIVDVALDPAGRFPVPLGTVEWSWACACSARSWSSRSTTSSTVVRTRSTRPAGGAARHRRRLALPVAGRLADRIVGLLVRGPTIEASLQPAPAAASRCR
jgi:hypothetical protein